MGVGLQGAVKGVFHAHLIRDGFEPIVCTNQKSLCRHCVIRLVGSILKPSLFDWAIRRRPSPTFNHQWGMFYCAKWLYAHGVKPFG